MKLMRQNVPQKTQNIFFISFIPTKCSHQAMRKENFLFLSQADLIWAHPLAAFLAFKFYKVDFNSYFHIHF